ncbi:hypothetical protein JTE90_019647 [Oedothorax gibbosus]|uniref:CCHC-type domain-containing protein n=1 Tax=Oedothorax gibbosus TaxID=931172 RepID=A0AAV6U241_9ARAC|nr:hypothetical protein JTE90_019647 [Oedothorax gibbosus]
MTKEPPKFIIKYTSLNDEKALLEQLVLKNPFFSTTSPKVLFKIDINKIDQYHWVIEIPPSAFKAVERLGFVYLGLGKHRLLEFVSIKHCKNCLEYGHTTKKCTNSGGRCIKCGDQKHTEPCSLRCFSCHKKNGSNDGSLELFKTDHRVASDRCPEYRKQERVARSRVYHGN